MTTGTQTIRVHIPLALRDHAGGSESADVAGETIGDVMQELMEQYPSLRRHIYTDAGELRGYVNIYINEDEIRTLSAGDSTAVAASDVVMIVPSIAGG